MENSFISLKFGLIKMWHFDKDFYEKNKDLIHDFNLLYEKMFDGCCSMFEASEKNKKNEEIKIKLCEFLDKFFDLGVVIDNNYDNKQYKTKKEYRDYILNYNKEN